VSVGVWAGSETAPASAATRRNVFMPWRLPRCDLNGEGAPFSYVKDRLNRRGAEDAAKALL
jgi:hypothetical protein